MCQRGTFGGGLLASPSVYFCSVDHTNMQLLNQECNSKKLHRVKKRLQPSAWVLNNETSFTYMRRRGGRVVKGTRSTPSTRHRFHGQAAIPSTRPRRDEGHSLIFPRTSGRDVGTFQPPSVYGFHF